MGKEPEILEAWAIFKPANTTNNLHRKHFDNTTFQVVTTGAAEVLDVIGATASLFRWVLNWRGRGTDHLYVKLNYVAKSTLTLSTLMKSVGDVLARSKEVSNYADAMILQHNNYSQGLVPDFHEWSPQEQYLYNRWFDLYRNILRKEFPDATNKDLEALFVAWRKDPKNLDQLPSAPTKKYSPYNKPFAPRVKEDQLNPKTIIREGFLLNLFKGRNERFISHTEKQGLISQLNSLLLSLKRIKTSDNPSIKNKAQQLDSAVRDCLAAAESEPTA